MKPLCIDLFCGLGGWTEGFLAEGYRVIGFDIEQRPYPGQLILQDIRTLHGAQLRDAAVIVASSPCQEFSYRAMPWKRAKALGPPVDGINLFYQAVRIQHEAQEAAGKQIPLIMENVKGAQKWIGRAAWHYGSFYLWGDVPALMPQTKAIKNSGGSWFAIGSPGQTNTGKNPDGRKVPGLNWSGSDKPGYKAKAFNDTAVARLLAERPSESQKGLGGGWFDKPYKERGDITGRFNSKSSARKAASAQIAKIPFPLASHIARVYKPRGPEDGTASGNGSKGRQGRSVPTQHAGGNGGAANAEEGSQSQGGAK